MIVIPREEEFTAGHPDIDFNSSILLADDSLNSESLPYSITSDLEDKLELYCSPVFEDRSDYKKRLESGDYDLCIAEIKGGTNSAEEFMQQIADFLPDGNSADELIKRADRCIDLSEKKSACTGRRRPTKRRSTPRSSPSSSAPTLSRT